MKSKADRAVWPTIADAHSIFNSICRSTFVEAAFKGIWRADWSCVRARDAPKENMKFSDVKYKLMNGEGEFKRHPKCFQYFMQFSSQFQLFDRMAQRQESSTWWLCSLESLLASSSQFWWNFRRIVHGCGPSSLQFTAIRTPGMSSTTQQGPTSTLVSTKFMTILMRTRTQPSHVSSTMTSRYYVGSWQIRKITKRKRFTWRKRGASDAIKSSLWAQSRIQSWTP